MSELAYSTFVFTPGKSARTTHDPSISPSTRAALEEAARILLLEKDRLLALSVHVMNGEREARTKKLTTLLHLIDRAFDAMTELLLEAESSGEEEDEG